MATLRVLRFWSLPARVLLQLLLVPLAAAVEESAAESAFRREDYTVQSPDFLDCTGPSFPPIWDEWYEAVMAWEKAIQDAVDAASQPGQDPTTWATGDDLSSTGARVAAMAHTLLEEWFHHLQSINGTGLDKVIRGYLPKEELNGTCYYGLIQALWVRAQLILMQPSYKQHKAEAMLELRTAMSIIGYDHRADYIESTRWPLKSMDLEVAVSTGQLRTEEELVLEQGKSLFEPPPGGWTHPAVWHDRERDDTGIIPLAFTLPVDFFAAPLRADIVKSRTDVLKIAAFGQHVALLSEPVTMIRGALPEFQVLVHWYLAQCRWRDPMHHYMCRLHCLLVGECQYFDDLENLGRRILRIAEYAAEGHVLGDVEELREWAQFPVMLDIAAQLWEEDRNLHSVHMIVCTVPLVCSLLRSVCPLPMLGYFSMTHYTNPSYDLGVWGKVHWAEMAKNTAQNAFAVSNDLLRDIVHGGMELKLPAVRPFGLYAFEDQISSLFPEPFAKLRENMGAYSRTVVVPRSRLAQQTSFLHALRWFTEATLPSFPLKFTIIRSSTKKDINMAMNPHPKGEPIGDLMAREENVFLDSKTMMLYRCAVVIPQSASMMSAYERHSMHLPTFITGVNWLSRLGRQGQSFPMGKVFTNASDPEAPSIRPPGRETSAAANSSGKSRPTAWSGPLLDPGLVFNLKRGLLRDKFFFPWRHETRLPGIIVFESFPELLDRLLFEDFPALRERMRKHNEEEFKPALRWYRHAVVHLMAGNPHYMFGKLASEAA